MNDLDKRVQLAKSYGYSDEEINQYLSAKKQTVQPQVQQPQVQQEGLISRMLKPTVDAFAGTAKNIVAGGGLIPQVVSSKIASKISPAYGAKVASGNMGLQKIAEETAKEPEAVKKQLKRSAIIASYAVPIGGKTTAFGMNVATAPFKGGAIAGGLYGSGQEDATPESVVFSAMLGGATAWATSKLFSGATSKGKELQEGVINKKPKDLKALVKNEGLLDKAQKMGIPTGSSNKKLDWAIVKYPELIEQLDDAVVKVKKPVDGTTLAVNAIDKAKNLADVSKGAGKNSAQFWSEQISSAKTYQDLAKIKFQLQAQLGGKTPTTDGKIVMQAFHDTIDDVLKSDKSIAKVLDDMTTLHAVVGTNQTGGLLSSSRLPDVNIPGTNLKIPGTRVAGQSISDVTGRGLENLGGLAPKIKPKDTVSNFLTGGGTLTTTPAFGAKSPQLIQAFTGGKSPDIVEVKDIDEFDKKVNEISNRVAPIDEKPNKYKITEQQMMQVFLNPKIKSSIKSDVAKAYKLQGGGLDATEKKKVAEAKDALKLVNLIEENYERLYKLGLTAQSPGLLQRAGGMVKGKTASLSGDRYALSYDNTLKAFTRKLARAGGEKGVLTDADIADFVNILPNFSTPPDAAREQFDYMKRIIEGNIEDYISSQKEDLISGFSGE